MAARTASRIVSSETVRGPGAGPKIRLADNLPVALARLTALPASEAPVAHFATVPRPMALEAFEVAPFVGLPGFSLRVLFGFFAIAVPSKRICASAERETTGRLSQCRGLPRVLVEGAEARGLERARHWADTAAA